MGHRIESMANIYYKDVEGETKFAGFEGRKLKGGKEVESLDVGHKAESGDREEGKDSRTNVGD